MILRPLRRTDQALLWDMLHQALWDPPPAPPRPRAVLAQPGVRIYAEDWGRNGDLGVVAEDEAGEAMGACWMRLTAPGQGLAWVDAATPQLGIALRPPYRGRGHGGALMRATLDAAVAAGVAQVSLTVHPLNPAIALYRRCGFTDAGERGSYRLMIARPGDGTADAPSEG